MSNKLIGIKTVLLGDTGVGKTSIALRFVTNSFNQYSESTIGASYLTKILHIYDNIYKFFIWDTAGQERYHSLAPMYYRNAAIAIIVYDITNKNTFLSVKKWVNELKNKGPPDIIIAIIGNKNDLSKQRKVSLLHATEYANNINAIFLETSAKDNINIDDLFKNIAIKIPKNNNEIYDEIVDIFQLNTKKNTYLCC